MGKLKFGVGDMSDAEPGEGGQFYDGETPPRGIYKVALKFLQAKTNKNGDTMLVALLEIREDREDKKQFNGYGIWHNMNVTEQGAPWVNAFLDTFGFNRSKFWNDGATVNEETDPPTVTKIGSKAIKGGEMCRVATKRETYKGEEKLRVQQFLPVDDDDSDSDPGDGAPF